MRILAVADIHGSGTRSLRRELYSLDKIDVMLLCGDLASNPVYWLDKKVAVQKQKKSLEIILFSLSKIPVTHEKFLLYGNDDFEELKIEAEDILKKYRFKSIDFKVKSVDDFVFIGMGGSNRTPFKTPYELGGAEIFNKGKELFEQVSDKAKKILVTHAPSYGVLDLAPRLSDGKSVHIGSRSIRKLVEYYKPQIQINGHIHESTGIKRFGATVVVNCASYVDSKFYSIIDINSENVASIYQCGIRDEEKKPVKLVSMEF